VGICGASTPALADNLAAIKRYWNAVADLL
jgi:hypothetical protein